MTAMHRFRLPHLSCLIATSILAACSEPPSPAARESGQPVQAQAVMDPPQPAPTVGDAEHDLLWLPDGSRLVVDGYWVFEPERGAFVSSHCATRSGGPCKLTRSSFVADGTEYVILDEESIAVGNLASGVGTWEQIPHWLATAQADSDQVANVGFWIGPGRVFVRQFQKDGQGEAQCRVRYTANGVVGDWRAPAGGCIAGELGQLTRVDPGPGALLALHSQAQGQFALSFVRYSQDDGMSRINVAPVRLEGSSQVHVRFAADGTRAELISPCALTGSERDVCADAATQPRWKLYSLAIPGDKVELVRDDLLPGTVHDPVLNRFAWVKGGRLCVGDPREPESRCDLLPVP